MNIQSSKKILFNKSSLFNLKAELLKKQEEILEKKLLPENRIENYKPPPAKASGSERAGKEKKSFKDGLKAVDTEELEACRKSKLALEKKAELYGHLADSAGNSQLAGRFLVDFKSKKDEELKEQPVPPPPVEIVDDVEDVSIENDNEEWVEFTDCLGRTRQCHRSDLESFKERDKHLKKAMFDEEESQGKSSESQEPQKEKPLLVRTTTDYLQSLRQKWEEKERELLSKDKDIHYQDLLFDEARIHGVGYYAFSTDEAERKKQIEELIKERENTLQAQKVTEEQRKKREELMAARVKAARARQRMRAGLPPEEPKDTAKEFAEHLLDFLTKQRNEVDAKAKEEERQKKEELEKERQILREAYIREWDLGKEGVEDKIKKFREMTQEEYVEQQRGKRIDEFAPPKPSTSKKALNTFDDQGKMLALQGPKTWLDVRPEAPTSPTDITNFEEEKGLYFTTKKQNAPANISRPKTPPPPNISKREVKYKNFVKAQEPTPIVNELSDDESEERVTERYNTQSASGTEIAPPPTYDYYGPISKKQKFSKPFESDMREAYAQGAKSLEHKSQGRQISKDYDFCLE